MKNQTKGEVSERGLYANKNTELSKAGWYARQQDPYVLDSKGKKDILPTIERTDGIEEKVG